MVGLLCHQPQGGPEKARAKPGCGAMLGGIWMLVAGDTTGSKYARRLLLAVLVILPLLGWLRLRAERAGLVGTESGILIVVIGGLLLLSAIILWSAGSLNQAEAERQEAEVARRDSEEQLSAIVGSAMDAIVSSDEQQRIVLFNPAAEQMFGLAASEAIGQPLGALIPERFRAMHDEHVRRFAQTGQTSRRIGALGEIVGLRANGEEFPIEASISQAWASGVKLLTVVLRDVAERKATENALRESEQRYRLLMDHAFDGISISERDSGEVELQGPRSKRRLVYCNDRYVEMSGRSREELLACDDLNALVITRATPEEREEQRQQLHDGQPRSGVSSWKRPDGRENYHEWVAVPLPMEGKLYTFGIDREITERRLAEEALRASEEWHRVLFESSRDALMTLAPPEWRITSANPAAIEMFAAGNEANFVSCAPWELSPRTQPDGRPSEEKAREMIETAVREGSTLFEWRHRRLNGEEFPASVLLTCFELGGQVMNQATVRDLTAEKRTQRAHDELEAQLRSAQKLEAVARLAGGVAHDFNNMLSVILGYGELLLEQFDVTAPAHQDLADIVAAAQRASDVARQLLAFSRQEVISPRVLELNQAVESLLKMLRRLIGEDIDLVWLPVARDLLIRIDPSQLDQLLANLCVNARDAIADVGRVTIETSTAFLDEGYAATHPECTPGDYAVLAVSDNGCGMPADVIDRIFEPFFTTKAVGQGTGLGLASVYGAVKQNQGTINVYSEPGVGTTFRVYLPLHAGPAIAEAPRQAAEAPVGEGETVLVVEDDAAILRLVARYVRELGYTTLTAGTVRDALALVDTKAGPIELLITDVIMPEMNGQELAGQIREHIPNVKVLFMSGYTADHIAGRGMLHEDLRLIQKPFSKLDLGKHIREVLDG